MKTKTKNLNDTNSFKIPDDIQKVVDERGFYLYEWIGFNEVIERVKFHHQKLFYDLGAVFIFLVPIEVFFAPNYILSIYNIPGMIIIFTIIFIYFRVFYLSITDLKLLKKSNKVVITDKYIYILNRIIILKDFNKTIEYKSYNRTKRTINKVARIFNKQLFGKYKKLSVSEETCNNFYDLYYTIRFKDIEFVINFILHFFNYKKFYFKNFSKEGLFKEGYYENLKKNTLIFTKILDNIVVFTILGMIIPLAILYSIVTIFVKTLYFISYIFISLSTIILRIIIKIALLITGNKREKINSLFKNTDRYSNKISQVYLTQNDILNINIINKLGKNMKKAIKSSIELKKALQNYKHSEMFNIKLYNSWIKKKIIEPIAGIDKILKSEISNIEKEMANIDKQLLKTEDSSLKTPLTLSQKRLVMKKEQMVKNSSMIEGYLGKLR